MAVTVQNILEQLNLEAPFHLAESWDNVGLLVGNPSQHVTGILVGLDPTNALIDEAIAEGCNTVITHHPVIFKPLATIDTGTPEGKLLEKALTHQIAIIGCHTNFDSAEEGVSDYLGSQLGLQEMVPMISHQEGSEKTGLGRIGSYAMPLSATEFLERLLHILQLPGVQIAGVLPQQITTVAICGGSGSEFAPLALEGGADVYISAEIKHSTAVWAVENNFCIIDGTHYATEKPAIALLVQKLRSIGDTCQWSIVVKQSEQESHPFKFMDKELQP